MFHKKQFLPLTGNNNHSITRLWGKVGEVFNKEFAIGNRQLAWLEVRSRKQEEVRSRK
jgi:hypothetical protein